jgi:hypothetical protein
VRGGRREGEEGRVGKKNGMKVENLEGEKEGWRGRN